MRLLKVKIKSTKSFYGTLKLCTLIQHFLVSSLLSPCDRVYSVRITNVVGFNIDNIMKFRDMLLIFMLEHHTHIHILFAEFHFHQRQKITQLKKKQLLRMLISEWLLTSIISYGNCDALNGSVCVPKNARVSFINSFTRLIHNSLAYTTLGFFVFAVII